MEEFPVPEQGQFDLFDEPDEPMTPDWDPSDYCDAATEPDDDDPDAWMASLPPDIRAELDARPPVTAAPSEGGAAARVAFADGGVCDAMPPGWYLGLALTEATLSGYWELTDDELAGVLRARQRQIASGYADLARTVTEIARRRSEQARRPGWSGVFEHVTDELAAELTLTGQSARRLLDVATGLQRLPAAYNELLNGAIDWPRACIFVDELSVLDDAAAQGIAERLADRAAGWTTGQLRAALVRAVLAADPGAAARRKSAGRKDTRVETWREPSGNATLAGRELPPAGVLVADAQLTADADWLRANGVPGTLAELRSMAYLARLSDRDLTALLPQSSADAASCAGPQGSASSQSSADAASCAGPQRSAGPYNSAGPYSSADAANGWANGVGGIGPRGGSGGAGRPPAGAGSIHLTMPLSALAGLSDSPAEVASYGPVDSRDGRELAELLARDPATRWCLTVTDPAGTALAHACARRGPAAGQPVIRWAADLRARLETLEHGTCSHARASAGYVPPPRLRHLVRVRQRRCSFPGCRRAAVRCDLDHTVPFEAGGPTCECNLAPLCRRHHRCKQTPGWQLRQDHPGVMTWRLPSGRTYVTAGDAYAE